MKTNHANIRVIDGTKYLMITPSIKVPVSDLITALTPHINMTVKKAVQSEIRYLSDCNG